ncbi:MAG: hypothetical protein B7Y58_09475, partial [Halothiobacillus sp. 35-54-62]
YLNGAELNGVAVDASRAGLGVMIPLANGQMAAKLGDELTLLWPRQSQAIQATVRTLRPQDKANSYLGVQYHLASINDERFSVAFAFGNSTQLEANNRARYGGRSIIGGLFFLIKLALRYGIAHLINLFKQHSGRLYRWLIHSF